MLKLPVCRVTGQVLSAHVAGCIVMKSYLCVKVTCVLKLPVCRVTGQVLSAHVAGRIVMKSYLCVKATYMSCDRSGAECPCGWPHRDEELPERDARVQVRHQRQGADGEQGQVQPGRFHPGQRQQVRMHHRASPT